MCRCVGGGAAWLSKVPTAVCRCWNPDLFSLHITEKKVEPPARVFASFRARSISSLSKFGEETQYRHGAQEPKQAPVIGCASSLPSKRGALLSGKEARSIKRNTEAAATNALSIRGVPKPQHC